MRKKNTLTLTKKINFTILPIILGGFLIVILFTYFYVSNIIKTDLYNNILQTVHEKTNTVDEWLKDHLLEVESIASTPAAQNINKSFDEIDALNENRYLYFKTTYPNDYSDIYSAGINYTYHTIQGSEGDLTVFVGSLKGRDYYESIKAGGPKQITPPLISKTTNKPTVFMVAPIKDKNGNTQGLIGAGIQLNFIKETAEQLKYGKSGYTVVIASDGTILVNPDQSLVMKKNTDKNLDALYKYMADNKSGIYHYNYKGQNMVAFFQKVPTTNWTIASIAVESELTAPITSLRDILIVLAVLTIGFTFLGIFIVTKILFKPLIKLNEITNQVSSGDLTGKVEITSKDEIGQLSENINIMILEQKNVIGKINDASKEMSQLSFKSNNDAQGMLKLSNEELTAMDDLTKTMNEMANSVMEIADSTNKFAELINSTTKKGGVATQKVTDAVNISLQGKLDMEKIIVEMNSIKESVSTLSHSVSNVGKSALEIKDIVGVIGGIATKTNLLALNAAIEAARAGESGKGFAVVADEIRKLAETSTKATSSISVLLGNVEEVISGTVKDTEISVNIINDGVQQIGNTSKNFESIFDAVNETNEIVQNIISDIENMNKFSMDIAATTEEQSASSEEILATAEGVNQMANSISNSSTQVVLSSETLTKKTDELKNLVGKFKVE
jgi:methyl-accepting chemotaxis protein